MSKRKKPSEVRADKRYWRTQDNLIAQAVDAVRRSRQHEQWVQRKGKK